MDLGSAQEDASEVRAVRKGSSVQLTQRVRLACDQSPRRYDEARLTGLVSSFIWPTAGVSDGTTRRPCASLSLGAAFGLAPATCSACTTVTYENWQLPSRKQIFVADEVKPDPATTPPDCLGDQRPAAARA